MFDQNAHFRTIEDPPERGTSKPRVWRDVRRMAASMPLRRFCEEDRSLSSGTVETRQSDRTGCHRHGSGTSFNSGLMTGIAEAKDFGLITARSSG